MQTSGKQNVIFINPNWSGFILLVTILAALNSAVLILFPLSDEAESFLRSINIAISIILWIDFIFLWRRSSDKRQFMGKQRGWMVLLGSFPLFRALRVIWFHIHLKADGYTLRDFLARIVIKRNAQGTLLVILLTVILVFQVSVVSILSFEDVSPDSNIKTISDAVWWAVTTVTTVGYGDKYPVTFGGRIIAMVLMAVGIALFSVITGSLAEWFQSGQTADLIPGRNMSPEDMTSAEAVAQMKQLLEKQEDTYLQTISELKEKLAALEANT